MKNKSNKSQDYKLKRKVMDNITEMRKLDAICIQLNNSRAYALIDEVENIERQICLETIAMSKSVDLTDEDVKYLNWMIYALS